MADLPPSLRSPLAFLVRLLASPHDGEVLGAARAIDRKLRSAGFDLNDLGDLVESRAAPSLSDPAATSSRQPSKRAASWSAPVYVDLTAERRATLLDALGKVLGMAEARLGPWDRRNALQLIDRLSGPLPLTKKMLDRADLIIAAVQEASQ